MAVRPGGGDHERVTARVVSVNLGRPEPTTHSRVGATAIHKQPVTEPVLVTSLGLSGDQVADLEHHGGREQAVYVFAREDLDRWETLLGRSIAPGTFGENLTTQRIDVNEALVGERWRIGSTFFEIASVRTPCRTFAGWLGDEGFDNRGWVRRFTAEGRPGPYLRVIEEGLVQTGDELEVVHRPDHGVTVTTMFRALTTQAELLPELLRVDRLPAEARRRAEEHVRRGA